MKTPVTLFAAAVSMAACRSDDCGPLTAAGAGMAVVVTHEDGCGGTTWMAVVTFDDGRTQSLGGNRTGRVTGALVGDVTGDGAADLVITAEGGRVHAFLRQGGILFGRELPPAGEGVARIEGGTLRVGGRAWDPGSGVWRVP